MNIAAIIQARMGSTRLPGKVLMDIGGASMLVRVVNRTLRASSMNQVVVATTVDAADDAIVEECANLGVDVFRGSQDDVLDRHYHAAKTFGADVIVRITSDCPLIDSQVIDRVTTKFGENDFDYVNNLTPRWFPRGLDTEVFSFAALERAWQQAAEPYQRAHVTPYIYQHPESFRLGAVCAERDYSAHRWTVDTIQDLELVRALYARFENQDTFGWREALAVVEREQGLMELNRAIQQKALHEG